MKKHYIHCYLCDKQEALLTPVKIYGKFVKVCKKCLRRLDKELTAPRERVYNKRIQVTK